ncbi:bifunctional phosphoribosyl-AMP cyclohydrolase/phosphoribosyl-ATP diphosphatase HisIE [Draconibacterium sp.]|nr:bifunctional phosphoribosyl-AMP cyclohydrolase/phosphoribosyl-ATP diphosphatase HisIE [Draconibacterium sp.]
MNELNSISQIDFDKLNGLIPAVVQDAVSMKVLMVGFMNKKAVEKTQEMGKVTFFSRTKNRLWTKGEESGNFLKVVSVLIDCDDDTLLIKANPAGPVCHKGSDTCFEESNREENDVRFLSYLQDFVDKRKKEKPEGSYTTLLFEEGTRKITQKVGEEAIETIIGAMADDDENFIYEAADLIYHLIVLLSHKGYRIEDIVRELKKRHA